MPIYNEIKSKREPGRVRERVRKNQEYKTQPPCPLRKVISCGETD